MRQTGRYVKVLYKDINLIEIMILIDKKFLPLINYDMHVDIFVYFLIIYVTVT